MTLPGRGNSSHRRTVQALAAAGIAAAAVVAVLLRTSAQGRPGPRLDFTVFSSAVPRPDGAVWTGSRFLFVQNTANVVWAVSPSGSNGARFAAMPPAHEEARCVLSSGAHGFAPGAFFCHSPDHRIWEFSAAGRRRLFAVLPRPGRTADDGAIAFDGVGRYGFALLAATGRSGAGHPPGGGALYAIDSQGRTRRVGDYTGPGGADQLIVAPPHFGSARAEALLTVDAGAADGRLIAVAPDGGERTLTTFPDGPNPIVALNRLGTRLSRRLYLTDDETHNVYVTSAAPLRESAGDVLVGSETRGFFWVVRPRGPGFETVPVGTNFHHAAKHSLEAMILAP
jgi:hypothetical protein